jgi:hypothetical protein
MILTPRRQYTKSTVHSIGGILNQTWVLKSTWKSRCRRQPNSLQLLSQLIEVIFSVITQDLWLMTNRCPWSRHSQVSGHSWHCYGSGTQVISNVNPPFR